MVAPALLALALGTLGVIAAPPSPSVSPRSPMSPTLSVSPPHPRPRVPFNVTCAFGHLGVPKATNATITANGSVLLTTDRWSDHGSDQQGDNQGDIRGGHQVTAVVTLDTEGSVQLGCSVRAGGVEGQSSRTVEVYTVPRPQLAVPEFAVAGAELRGLCSLPAGAISDIQVRVLAGPRQVRGWARPPLRFGIAVPPQGEREDDDGEDEDGEEQLELELSCEAELQPLPPRRERRRIPIKAKPRLDPRDCPAQQNWTEGEQEILECRARGRPRPHLECSRNSGNSRDSLPVGIAQRAGRAQAGIYQCRAWNELGTAQSNVTVWVQHSDSVPLLPILLGIFIPILTLLVLAGFYLLHHHNTKIGEYRLWKRHPPPAQGHPRATKATKATKATGATPNGAP